jgi:UrcA family protein
MRHAALGCVLALACALPAAAQARDFGADDAPAPAPQARFRYGDLRLDTQLGQNRLVDRVLAAARDYCRDHADIVSPPSRRPNVTYCVNSMRIQFMDAMPAEVRTAFDRGWRRRERRPGGA